MTTFALDALPESQRPTLDRSDRDALLRSHFRADVRYIDDEVIRLAEPECVECGEPWGQWGCRTVRAVTVLAIRETDLKAEQRRTAELTEALTPRFGVHRLMDTRNQCVEIKMRIDHYTLMQGGLGIVYATLDRMGAEFKKWWRTVGERERIAEDHRYALALDSDRYTYLTQEFDPTAPYIKAPNAPWDA